MKSLKRFGALFLSLVLAPPLTLPAFAAVEDTGYSDVDAGASYAEAVVYCREHELMNGVGNGRFDPEGELTRAELATVLWRLEGKPVVNYLMQFSDVGDDWYTEAVRWAASEKIMGGYGGGVFGRKDPVTRQDMVTVLWRYADRPTAEVREDFDDEADVADYASTAVDWAVANGIAGPVSDGAFAPRANATRAQIAVALMGFVQNVHPTPDPEPGNAPKFSATNNTEGIANHLNAILDADIYEIAPETPYTSADLNYNTDCRANREQNDASARPAISGSVGNMEQYDVIFLGYPNWWASIPMPIASFLEEYDFSGKTIIPFCSHGGGRFGQSLTAITKLVPDAVLGEGLAVSYFGGSGLSGDVTAWLEENNIPAN